MKWNLWSRLIEGYMTSLSFSFSPFCLFRVLRWFDRDVSVVVCGREVVGDFLRVMSVQWLFGRICRYGWVSDVWYGDEVVWVGGGGGGVWGGGKGGMGSCGMVWGPWCSQKGLRR